MARLMERNSVSLPGKAPLRRASSCPARDGPLLPTNPRKDRRRALFEERHELFSRHLGRPEGRQREVEVGPREEALRAGARGSKEGLQQEVLGVRQATSPALSTAHRCPRGVLGVEAPQRGLVVVATHHALWGVGGWVGGWVQGVARTLAGVEISGWLAVGRGGCMHQPPWGVCATLTHTVSR